MIVVRKGAAFIFMALIFSAGCRRGNPAVPATTMPPTPRPQTAAPSPTPSPSPTPTASLAPTPTATSTPPPTPTPTAPPLAVSGDPRAVRLSTPVPQSGAACGVVDVLDFPLDPPDAENITFAGQDFGVYRGRYDKYHAGEDWWASNRRGSFGLPVYSIGHGTVTYAQPLGWGRDQGVVIVRHLFDDGRTFLSFYGHLDPPSIVLRVGDCVARGEQVGAIGRPKTPPHLHFEIRTHLPDEPGGGYWFEDPTLAGWLPPSPTIWHNRVASAPGVQWARPFAGAGAKGIGMWGDDTFIALEAAQLVGVAVEDGRSLWTLSSEMEIANALLDTDCNILYAANRRGRIEAYRRPDPQGNDTIEPDSEPLWTAEFDVIGRPALLPLPGGGVALSVWGRTFAVSPEGALLWETDLESWPFDWLLADEGLFLSTSGRDGAVWLVAEAGPEIWTEAVNGRFVHTGDQIWNYDDEGVYRLNPASNEAELIYPLPRSFLGLGSIAALPAPDDGVILAHRDRFDQRLIVLNADGTVRWQRSYAADVRGETDFLVANGRTYLTAQDNQSAFNELSVYAIDLENAELTHIFTGGTRSAIPLDTWTLSVDDDTAVINIGGGSMVALDTRQALKIVTAPVQEAQ